MFRPTPREQDLKNRLLSNPANHVAYSWLKVLGHFPSICQESIVAYNYFTNRSVLFVTLSSLSESFHVIFSRNIEVEMVRCHCSFQVNYHQCMTG
jgi:hypothetical protein